MIDPYRMVVVSLISFFIVLVIIFIYKKYRRSALNYKYILLLLSIPPLISVLRKGTYESGDFNIHIYRTISFYENLMTLNLMPSWAGGLNGEFGYPLFIFINPLSYYFISTFHFIGISYIASIKLFIIVTYLVSGFAMYAFSIKLFKNKLAALTASIFYLYAPYHLIDMHFRNDIGELLVFALFPIALLLLLYCYQFPKKNVYFATLGIIGGLIILSHQAIALMIAVLFIAFIFSYFIHKKRFDPFLGKLIISFIIAIILSSYSWITYFIYTPFTNVDLVTTFKIYLLEFSEILYSPYWFGFLFQGPMGELAQIIGYTQLFILATTGFLLLTKRISKNNKYKVLFLFLTSLIFIFMLIEQSEIIWKTIPLIKNILLSYRLHLIITLLISVLSGYVVLELKHKYKNYFIYILIFLTIFLTILNWGNRRTIPEINDTYLIENAHKSTFTVEGLSRIGVPKWTGEGNTWVESKPESEIEVLSGTAEILPLNKTPTSHTYQISVDSNVYIKENTWYFPGWSVKANNEPIPIIYENPDYPGVITFSLTKGEWLVEVYYEDLAHFKFIKAISVTTFMLLSLYTIYALMQHRRLKK